MNHKLKIKDHFRNNKCQIKFVQRQGCSKVRGLIKEKVAQRQEMIEKKKNGF